MIVTKKRGVRGKITRKERPGKKSMERQFVEGEIKPPIMQKGCGEHNFSNRAERRQSLDRLGGKS